MFSLGNADLRGPGGSITGAGVVLVPIILPGGPCEFSSVAGDSIFQHVDNSIPQESGFESPSLKEFPQLLLLQEETILMHEAVNAPGAGSSA